MLPILNIGPLAVQLPGLLLLAGVWVGSTLAERAAPRNGVSAEAITNLIFYSLILGVVGARLGYALRFLSIYLENPLGLFALNPSTLSLSEGVLVAVLSAVIYGQRRGMPLWSTLDSLAPAAGAFTVALGLAHLASGDAFGAVTELPWAIELWGASRHPTQLYETALAALALAVVLRLQRKPIFPGFTIMTWLAMISASYLLVSGFRGDSVIVFEVLRRGQLISFLVLLLALSGLHLRARQALGSQLQVQS